MRPQLCAPAVAVALVVPCVARAQPSPPSLPPPPPPNVATAASPSPAAAANANAPARHYASGSISLLGGAALGQSSQIDPSYRQDGVATYFNATARFVHSSHLMLQLGALGGYSHYVQSGASIAATGVPAVSEDVVNLGASVGGGVALALNEHVALTPLVQYTLSWAAEQSSNPVATGSGPVGHTFMLEVPLTVFLGRHAFVEPYLSADAYLSGVETSLSVLAGTRFGATF